MTNNKFLSHTLTHLRAHQATFLNHARATGDLDRCSATLQAYLRELTDGANPPRIAFSEILDYEQPTKYLVSSEQYTDAYATPVLTANKGFVLGYTAEDEGIYPASPKHPVIIFDDFTTAVQWVDFPFKVKSSALKILTARDGSVSTLRYAWQALQHTGFTPTEHKRHWISTISNFELPWPAPAIRTAISDFFGIGVANAASLTRRR